MLKGSERYVLTTGKASIIREALSLVLAGIKPAGELNPGTREKLEAFARERCDRLILDLRIAEELPSVISPGVKNLRVSHLGQVLVVSGEVTAPHILHEIDALRCRHPYSQYLALGLLAFFHMLF